MDTISELAKTEQGETEVFRNRTDNVRQPYIVRQVSFWKDSRMGQEIKLIRKQFRITRQEEKQIKEMMREQKVDSFSEFLRQNLLKKNYQDRIFESWFSLWQSQKFEQISRDVHEVLVVARENHQVTQEHVSILLTCVQELIAEVNQVQPLSRGFREKYMR